MNTEARPTTLFLGSTNSSIWDHVNTSEPSAVHTDRPIDPDFLARHHIGVVVSHGYRHILRPPTLSALPDRFVNLHIALLPWNRGADPNLWSFLEDTPKGVSIHYIDEGIDTGDIIAQRKVPLGETGTLATTYLTLQAEIHRLFVTVWPSIKAATCDRTPQAGPGSTHKLRDKEPYLHLLTKGWHTPVKDLIGRATNTRKGTNR